MLLRGDPLDLHRRTIGRKSRQRFVVREDLVGAQALEVVLSHQQREVGEALHEGFVVPLVIDHQFRDAEPKRGVGRRPDGNPIVGFGRGRAVFRRDHNDLGPTLHALDKPVGVREFVLDEILPVHDDELGGAQIVEVAIRGLQSVHPRVSRCLVAVPGVVREIAPGAGMFVINATDFSIEQGEGVVEAIHAVLADNAEQAHSATHLNGASTCPAHLLDHLGLVALGQQLFGSLLATVTGRNGGQRLGDIVERILPGDLDELVLAAVIKHVLGLVFRRQLGKTGIGPGLPSFSDDRVSEPIRSVDHSVESVSLGALAGVPIGSGLIAVKVGVCLVIVGIAEASDNTVSHVGADAAGVGVVWGANPIEGLIVPILIAVNFFPGAIHRAGERVLVRSCCGQQAQR